MGNLKPGLKEKQAPFQAGGITSGEFLKPKRGPSRWVLTEDTTSPQSHA